MICTVFSRHVYVLITHSSSQFLFHYLSHFTLCKPSGFAAPFPKKKKKIPEL